VVVYYTEQTRQAEKRRDFLGLSGFRQEKRHALINPDAYSLLLMLLL